MPILKNPSAGILLKPAATWTALRAADPPWTAPIFGHALPLALLPSVAWPLGQASEGVIASEAGALAAAFAATLAFTLATVVLLAVGIYLMSHVFGALRSWNRAIAVAAYSSTPVFLSGALLVVPMLVIASLAALAHFFLLCDMGVQRMLDCRDADSMGLVVAACVFAGVASALIGALCSAAGLI